MATLNYWISQVFILMIKGYRFLVSPWLGQRCRFYPSCSRYTEQALRRYGCLKGGWLAIKRLIKCHPWHPGGIDLLQ